ncbi:MAG: EscU/YscU/HrcU family type III secretion system export apparatus switch protein [Syntrophomonadaceae bacterium]|jgi:flagellar biosynthesis protein
MTEEQPLPRAVALSYDQEKDLAPVVVAKGQGLIAEHIKALAVEHNIPIQEDQVLLRYLMALDLYEEIPPELYQVVAEILAFIYRINQRY